MASETRSGKCLEQVDILIINDGEARALGQDSNLVKVAKLVLSRGPKHLIVKRGEYGVLMFNDQADLRRAGVSAGRCSRSDRRGDTFAGGFLGYLGGDRKPVAGGDEASHHLWKRDGVLYRRSL